MEIIINGRFLTQRITGVQRYAHELVRALDGLLDATPEIKVTVMSPRLSSAAPAWRNIVLRQVGFLRGHAWEQFELPWYSRGKTLFCPGNAAPIASLWGSQRVVVTVHDLCFRYFPDAYSKRFRLWYGFLIPLILRSADAVITVSKTERTAILEHYPRAKAKVHAISNGGLPASLNSEPESSHGEPTSQKYILYVGSRSRHKNFHGALQAASRLIQKRGLHFVFVGGLARGFVSSDIKLPQAVASHITLAGPVDDATLFRYYRHAACFVFPSFYEASGLAPIEAMACGCPTVVSNIPALKERCGDAAVYCNPYDIDSIAAAIERIVDDEALRTKLKTLGRQRAANCSWEACARDTFMLLR